MNERVSWSQTFEALAAFAAAVAVATWSYAIPMQLAFHALFKPDAQTDPIAFAPLLTAVIAVATAVATHAVPHAPGVTGWLITAAALIVMAIAAQLPGETSFYLSTAAAGLALGGTLAAAAATTPTGRTVIAAAFTTGLVLSPVILRVTAAALGHDHIAGITPATIQYAALAILVIAAAALAPSPTPPTTADPPLPLIACIVAAGVVLSAGRMLLTTLSEPLYPYGSIALALAVAAIPLWYLTRQPATTGKRWAILALALAAPTTMMASTPLYLRATALPTAIVLIAAATGALLAIRQSTIPWDAAGAALAATGVYLNSQYAHTPAFSTTLTAGALLTGGTALALTFALTRLLLTHTEHPPAHTAAQAATVLATALLAGQALAPALVLTQTTGTYYTSPPIAIPALTLLAALALTLHRQQKPTTP